ncbi:MAG: metalloregulator ArsR/SmtB family transcription factor [Alphaproteobacteria bacterium]|jgi:DNA-binding transcriptional ArsR family regulator|nr:metalloregulator ArsR/SmtB family transcription factor [Alphaproteobacteria bacterium]
MTTEAKWAGPASVLFRTLGNELRLRILHHLMEGEKSIDELTRLTGASRTIIPTQLARLQRDNLVSSRREERYLFYSLTSRKVPGMLEAAQRTFAS